LFCVLGVVLQTILDVYIYIYIYTVKPVWTENLPKPDRLYSSIYSKTCLNQTDFTVLSTVKPA
jgi:hypothetical protein